MSISCGLWIITFYLLISPTKISSSIIFIWSLQQHIEVDEQNNETMMFLSRLMALVHCN